MSFLEGKDLDVKTNGEKWNSGRKRTSVFYIAKQKKSPRNRACKTNLRKRKTNTKVLLKIDGCVGKQKEINVIEGF